MVRHQLKKIKEVRGTFTGTFQRFGIKSGWHGKEMQTILLKEIKDHKGRIITDHLWFNYTKGFQKLNLRKGVCLQFNARVKPYLKGYARDYGEQEIDYKLSHPTKTTNPTKNNHKPHTTHKNTPTKTKNFKILKKTPPEKNLKKIVEKKESKKK